MKKEPAITPEYRDFYTELPSFERFSDGLLQVSARIPDDWFVVMTDVVDSTGAIEAGKYKTVNMAGALPIIALARIYGNLQRPFVFGGDGMTFLVDPGHVDRVRLVLSRVLRDISGFFDLELRASVIPVRRLAMEGGDIRVAKMRVSSQYSQALLHGNGIQIAETILKDASGREDAYRLTPANDDAPVNYEGFTCRWADVPSPTGITAAIIVEPRGSSDPVRILSNIEDIIGHDDEYHPLRVEGLHMGGRKSSWRAAYLVKSRGRKNFRYFLSLLAGGMMIAMTRLFYTLRIPVRIQIYDVNRLREQNIANSDFRKYEGSLKMIVALSEEKLALLRESLENARRRGELYYGIHSGTEAHMTCIATIDSGDDIHFVDAGGGGYALAARELKAQRVTFSY